MVISLGGGLRDAGAHFGWKGVDGADEAFAVLIKKGKADVIGIAKAVDDAVPIVGAGEVELADDEVAQCVYALAAAVAKTSRDRSGTGR